MKRRVIRITEEDLQNIVNESVMRIIKENKELLDEGKRMNKFMAGLLAAGIGLGGASSCSNNQQQKDLEDQPVFHAQVFMPNAGPLPEYTQEELDSLDREYKRHEDYLAHGKIEIAPVCSDGYMGENILDKNGAIKPELLDSLKKWSDEGIKRGYQVQLALNAHEEQVDPIVRCIRKALDEQCDIFVKEYHEYDYNKDKITSPVTIDGYWSASSPRDYEYWLIQDNKEYMNDFDYVYYGSNGMHH